MGVARAVEEGAGGADHVIHLIEVAGAGEIR